jgi:hypothetical protein
MGITYDYQFHSILCWLLGINKGVTMKKMLILALLFMGCAEDTMSSSAGSCVTFWSASGYTPKYQCFGYSESECIYKDNQSSFEYSWTDMSCTEFCEDYYKHNGNEECVIY